MDNAQKLKALIADRTQNASQKDDGNILEKLLKLKVEAEGGPAAGNDSQRDIGEGFI